jgi:uncharacterized protein YceK
MVLIRRVVPMLMFLSLMTAFNLVCATVSTHTQSGSHKHNDPQKFEMRLDLDSKRWCGGEADQCENTLPIQDVTESFIIIYDIKEGIGKERSTFTISRETGKFFVSERSESGDFITSTEGVCEKVPFTGFPTRKF